MIPQLRLQLGPPGPDDGSEYVDNWLGRLLSYHSLNDQDYRLIATHYLEHAPEAATRDHIVQYCDYDMQNDDPAKAADCLASVVFNLLLQITERPAYTVTRGTPDDNGFEAPRQAMITSMVNIVFQQCTENGCIEHVTKWEFEVSEYDWGISERLPDLLRATLLISKTSGAMIRYLCMHTCDLTTH